MVISLIFATQSDAKIDPKSIAGIWLFDEGQSNAVKDSSPNKNHGGFSDSKGIKWVDGQFGKALEFKESDYVVIPHSTSLDLNDTITVALWIKIETVGNYPSVMFKGICGTPGYWGLHDQTFLFLGRVSAPKIL